MKYHSIVKNITLSTVPTAKKKFILPRKLGIIKLSGNSEHLNISNYNNCGD